MIEFSGVLEIRNKYSEKCYEYEKGDDNMWLAMEAYLFALSQVEEWWDLFTLKELDFHFQDIKRNNEKLFRLLDKKDSNFKNSGTRKYLEKENEIIDEIIKGAGCYEPFELEGLHILFFKILRCEYDDYDRYFDVWEELDNFRQQAKKSSEYDAQTRWC